MSKNSFAFDASSDDDIVLKTLFASARLVTACILELRKRSFDIDAGDNYGRALRFVKEVHDNIEESTAMNYVCILRKYLQMNEEELPPIMSLTYLRRRSARQSIKANESAVESNKVLV